MDAPALFNVYAFEALNASHEYGLRMNEQTAREEFRSPRAATEIIREISLNKVGAGWGGEELHPILHPFSRYAAYSLPLPRFDPRAATIARFHAENMHAEYNRNFAKCLPTARISRARLPSPAGNTCNYTKLEVSLTLISIWPACTGA